MSSTNYDYPNLHAVGRFFLSDVLGDDSLIQPIGEGQYWQRLKLYFVRGERLAAALITTN